MGFRAVAAIVVCAVNASVIVGADAKGKANAAGGPAPTVTVSGCLEHDKEAFRLTGTSGSQAPKERSWKTGFMRTRNSDLAIVEAPKKVKLGDHVGHRVSMTGTLTDRQMRVASMRHLAASCGR